MEFRKGILFVRLRGILNGDTCYQLEDHLTSLVRDNGIKYLLINLNELNILISMD
jgi:anti-anti-sigma regulatory factor